MCVTGYVVLSATMIGVYQVGSKEHVKHALYLVMTSVSRTTGTHLLGFSSPFASYFF